MKVHEGLPYGSFPKLNKRFKGRVQSVCKQSLCLHFGIQNIELCSTTIYIFMLLSIINDQGKART
jgi:hypothetical protein